MICKGHFNLDPFENVLSLLAYETSSLYKNAKAHNVSRPLFVFIPDKTFENNNHNGIYIQQLLNEIEYDIKKCQSRTIYLQKPFGFYGIINSNSSTNKTGSTKQRQMETRTGKCDQ